MAARIRDIKHDERTREKIQTSQLINRLMAHAFGTVEMTPTQVRAAEIVLRKSLPDLAMVEHKGAIEHSYVMRVPATARTTEEWQQQHAPQTILQ